MKGAWFLFIPAYFALIFKPVSSSEQWNCNSLNPYLTTEGPARKRPLYGMDPKTLQIDSEDDLKYLFEEMKKINALLLEKNGFNSVDDYTEFHEDYKKSGLTFEEFFISYKPIFQGRSGFVDFPIAILSETKKKLSIKWENIGSSMFVAAAQYRIPIWTKTLNSIDSNYLQTINGQKINHVFAALRFSLEGKVGHILFNPGFNLVDGLILMKDGGSPFKDNATRNEDILNIIVYKTAKSDSDFIIGRKTTDQSLFFVIYVGKAYCSYLDITQKLELLRFDRYLFDRNTDGKILGGIGYDAHPKFYRGDHKVYMNRFTAFFYSGNYNKRFVYRPSLSKFHMNGTIYWDINEYDNKFFQNVANKLSMRRSQLYRRLAKLQKIACDDTFLSMTYKYHMNVNYLHSDNGTNLMNTLVKTRIDESYISDNNYIKRIEAFLIWPFRRQIDTFTEEW